MPRVSKWFGRRRFRPPARPFDGPLDPLAADFVNDPYASLSWLREYEPVHRAASGAWVLTRYDDIDAALKSADLGNSPAHYAVVHPRNRNRYVCSDVANNTLPFLDGPGHQSLRQTIARCWAQTLREQTFDLAGQVRGLLPETGATIDLLEDMARPLAVSIISEILGVPLACRAALQADAHWMFYLFTGIPDAATREQIDAALTRMREVFGRILDSQDAGVIQRLKHANVARETLIDNLILLWADGIENVDKGMAAAVGTLLAHPDQWKQLTIAPDLASQAADECLRFESPGQFIARIAQRPLSLGDQAIGVGQTVLLMLASANRDPARIEAPDRLEIRRARPEGLVFGKGAHSCVGAALTRRELTALLQTLATDCPNAASAGPIEWQARLGHRWPARVPVHLGA